MSQHHQDLVASPLASSSESRPASSISSVSLPATLWDRIIEEEVLRDLNCGQKRRDLTTRLTSQYLRSPDAFRLSPTSGGTKRLKRKTRTPHRIAKQDRPAPAIANGTTGPDPGVLPLDPLFPSADSPQHQEMAGHASQQQHMMQGSQSHQAGQNLTSVVEKLISRLGRRFAGGTEDAGGAPS